jgi:hypothetical protein
MTTIHTRAHVDAHGKVVIDVGESEAGREVTVTIAPVPPPVTQEEYQRVLRETAGSIPDLERPPQGEYERPEPLE